MDRVPTLLSATAEFYTYAVIPRYNLQDDPSAGVGATFDANGGPGFYRRWCQFESDAVDNQGTAITGVLGCLDKPNMVTYPTSSPPSGAQVVRGYRVQMIKAVLRWQDAFGYKEDS